MKEIDESQNEPEPTEEQEPESFDELDLQHKMAELTTSMVATNVKQIIKSQKLSDSEYDALLKRMLYKKLCIDEPKPRKKCPKRK